MLDFRSDTVTRPSESMRDAARSADVGDEKRDGDPSVRALESAVADRLGMDAGVFVPSGTMANHLAVRVLSDPGQAVITDALSHIVTAEYNAVSWIGHRQTHTIDSASRGTPSASAIASAATALGDWPGVGMVVLENTHNRRGGLAIGPDRIRSAAEAAHDRDLSVHLDGARLGNAAVARDAPLQAYAEPVDTVMFDLSKGLGAPVGAVLAGDADTIARARRHRNAVGGGMRQAGIVAAPGHVALENVDRLAEDHRTAVHLADRLAAIPGISVREPETNLVFVDPTGLLSTETFVERCREADVGCGLVNDTSVRFCTHLDVDKAAVDAAVDRIEATVRVE